MNWTVIIIVVVFAAALIIFLIKRNKKDEKEFEKELNTPVKQDESESNDENDNL